VILFQIYLLPFVIIKKALALGNVIGKGNAHVAVLFLDKINAFPPELCFLFLYEMFEEHIAYFII
jgi:hypothetical protein